MTLDEYLEYLRSLGFNEECAQAMARVDRIINEPHRWGTEK